ncbi:putative arginine N-methyltransferase, type II [Trypanosoma theileri]|uniref:Putative arginine N-methyltransferase, type II n=1 Tax=Trypanosoma theileri TaxID=67003 RepID=A0A1X0NJ28_9TRYP|nr:putative arginine N-methyltransferase, type II [Trypanosoma theileri]ORC84189.1 putative arginine N-methyltransferase, type II [Trypanosoma theileri]
MEKEIIPGGNPVPSVPSDFEVCDQIDPSADEAMYSDTSRDGGSQVHGLQQYGVSGGKTLLSSLQQQEMCKASLCLFPLGNCANNNNNADSTTPSCSLFTALVANEEKAGGSVEHLWEFLSHTSSWGPTACGCVSPSSWRTPSEVKTILEQLRLAAFLGLRAVMVPLPENNDSDSDSDDDTNNDNNNYGSDGDSVVARAISVLREHLRHSPVTNIWVRCDASCSSHRLNFSRLRTVLMWGSSLPSLAEAADCVARESVHRVFPYLFFSQTFGALPSEWLGEPVVAFEVPSEDKMRRALCSNAKEGVHLHLPSDVIPLAVSFWATPQPRFITLGSFMVELLRRRAIPVFALTHFADMYNIMNQLYKQTVIDSGKDTFADFEDVLQLPLQPLGHMLPSGTYEVFERDRTKYQQYHAALVSYFSNWLSHRKERSHALLCNQCANGPKFIKTDSVYIVLLGAGRGPLIEECLSAASGVGLRVHLFAVEKNPEALEFVRLRLRSDVRWSQWMNTCGHVVEVIHADGRTISSLAAKEKNFPIEWGLCDLVVSELLGSFGDNELSPECIDDFYSDLQQYQTSMGIPHNPYIVSIPQAYTAWIAPLYSAWMESSVATAAISGLTVLPSYCSDRRAALFHSMFVTNITRAVALSEPQACWTFHHFTSEEEEDDDEEGQEKRKEREAKLTFHLTSAGRCSGFIGYFTALLFKPDSAMNTDSNNNNNNVDPVHISTTLSTLYQGRTPNMFSWFPCVFALEPRDILEASAGDLLHLHLRRCVNVEESRVWYSYDASIECPEKDNKNKNKNKKKEEEEEEVDEERKKPTNAVKKATGVVNDKGWAASIFLSF